MSNLEKVQKYIEEHCKNCDKKIDCKIIEKINGQLQCFEDQLMIECLETNKVCSNGKKCKECKFDDCKEVIKMIETQEQIEERYNMKKLKEELPEQCRECSMLEIIDAKKKKVYCPYMIKERCMLK